MPSKNKFGKFWVFRCVANHAQHLNVCWISSKAGGRAVRFNVVALQIFLASAFFALATFMNNLADDFSTVVFSFACAAFPVWMIRTFWHGLFCSAFFRAIFASAAVAFSNLKLFAARFARAVNQGLYLFWVQFVRARTGAGVCFAPNVRIWTTELDTANGACQNATTATFNLPLEFRHG
jgi:hypothetical protein